MKGSDKEWAEFFGMSEEQIEAVLADKDHANIVDESEFEEEAAAYAWLTERQRQWLYEIPDDQFEQLFVDAQERYDAAHGGIRKHQLTSDMLNPKELEVFNKLVTLRDHIKSKLRDIDLIDGILHRDPGSADELGLERASEVLRGEVFREAIR